MKARVAALLVVLAGAAQGADPAGWGCPIPRALHPGDEGAAARAARGAWQRPLDCCGVVINGVRYFAPGVACWPLVEGDDVTAQSWPAVLLLSDGTRVYLGERARLKLDSTIHLISGTVIWKLGARPARHVAAGDQPIAASEARAELHDGAWRITPGAPLPALTPDLVELLRRFPYSAGILLPSDVP